MIGRSYALSMRWFAVTSSVAVVVFGGVASAADDAAGVKFFEEKVRPLLVEHCYECHSAEAKELRGTLRLDNQAGWRKGGDLGPAITPGKPKESLLIRAVGYADEELQMPPKGKLAQSDIDILTRWVEIGAPDPRKEEVARP